MTYDEAIRYLSRDPRSVEAEALRAITEEFRLAAEPPARSPELNAAMCVAESADGFSRTVHALKVLRATVDGHEHWANAMVADSLRLREALGRAEYNLQQTLELYRQAGRK